MANMHKNEIVSFMHCRKCLDTKPDSLSMRQWARLEVGVTSDGHLQVWCVRHDVNVMHTEDTNPIDTACEQCQKGVPHAH